MAQFIIDIPTEYDARVQSILTYGWTAEMGITKKKYVDKRIEKQFRNWLKSLEIEQAEMQAKQNIADIEGISST